MGASNRRSSEAITPNFEKWEGLQEQKHALLNGVVLLLGSLFNVIPNLALTHLGLCTVASAMLYFNRDTPGVLGALVIAVLMCAMGLVSKPRSSEQHAKSRENAAVPSPKPGDERGGSRKPRVSSRADKRG
jgi:hypothetical protein